MRRSATTRNFPRHDRDRRPAKAANPVITGYEFHVLQLVSQVCPHKRILPYLKQTLTEL
ncbi:MAG: 2-hydroxyacyl-CoA dehydratase family protein [Oscillospiraceae bacterium]